MSDFSTIQLDDTYDDIVSFGRVLAETICIGSSNPTEILLSYFEAPHKWEVEYQKWLELGGTLDPECLRTLRDELEFLREIEQDIQNLQRARTSTLQQEIREIKSKLNARIIEVLEAKSNAIKI